jgi:hypothetical protein
MRNLLLALTFLTLLAQTSCGPVYVVQSPTPAPAPPPPAPEESYQSFYDALSPYGEWINNPEYGYVWMPNAGPDFKPYATNGNWAYTDEGWAWESDYSWGWAPFHYGRWFYEDGYGWMWIPGNEWAPAWVSWRESPDYYGWAPLGPSVSVSVAFGGGYDPPPHYWCFVPHQYVTSPHLNSYYVGEQQNVTIIHNTTVIHNTTIINNNTTVNNRGGYNRNNYAGGPDPNEVSRFTGAQLRPIAVRESNTPGGNRAQGSFAVYRPRINAAPQANNGGSAFHPAPSRVQNLNNVHPVNSTIYNNRGNVNNTTINTTTTNNSTINNNNTNNTYNNGLRNPGNNGQPGYQPAAQPNGQPAFQPGGQSRFQPAGQPRLQPGGQPANPVNPAQPANQPGSQPAGQPIQPGGQPLQPAGQPLQPGGRSRFQPALQPNNTRYNNPTPNTAGGNPAITPNTPKPAANPNPRPGFVRPTVPGASNATNQQNPARLNPNPPKPKPQLGQNPPDTRRKPDPNNPTNKP